MLESRHALIESTTRHLPGEHVKPRKPSVRIVGLRTWNPQIRNSANLLAVTFSDQMSSRLHLYSPSTSCNK
jgi:hypothetical protein